MWSQGTDSPIEIGGAATRELARGRVVSTENLPIYEHAAAVLNGQAANKLYQVELHPNQTNFLGGVLSPDFRRICIMGDWRNRPYPNLSEFFDEFWKTYEAAHAEGKS